MRFGFSWTAAAVVIAMTLVPMKTTGCGAKTACIKAKQGPDGATCPSAVEATTFFHSQCAQEVASADGEPTFDGQFCCYPVTMFDNGSFGDFPAECFGGGGFSQGGFAGCGGCGCDGNCGGFGGFGAAGGFGGEGGSVCVSCPQQFDQGGEPSLLCSFSFDRWNELLDCGCNVCGTECELSICFSEPATPTCTTCLQNNCAAQFINCMNDI